MLHIFRRSFTSTTKIRRDIARLCYQNTLHRNTIKNFEHDPNLLAFIVEHQEKIEENQAKIRQLEQDLMQNLKYKE